MSEEIVPNILDKGQTPEAWSDLLKGHGVHVSPRLIRSRARKTGDFFKIGRLMLLTPDQIERLFDGATTTGATSEVQNNVFQQGGGE